MNPYSLHPPTDGAVLILVLATCCAFAAAIWQAIRSQRHAVTISGLTEALARSQEVIEQTREERDVANRACVEVAAAKDEDIAALRAKLTPTTKAAYEAPRAPTLKLGEP